MYRRICEYVAALLKCGYNIAQKSTSLQKVCLAIIAVAQLLISIYNCVFVDPFSTFVQLKKIYKTGREF